MEVTRTGDVTRETGARETVTQKLNLLLFLRIPRDARGLAGNRRVAVVEFVSARSNRSDQFRRILSALIYSIPMKRMNFLTRIKEMVEGIRER